MARYRRARQSLRPRSLIVVATEGEHTERIYLNALASQMDKKQRRLQVIPSRRGKTSPKHILKNVLAARRNYGATRKGDSAWIVIDRDRWTDGELDAVRRDCDKHGVKIAMSNPCFELWLVLHLDAHRTPPECSESAELLATALGGFDKSSYDVDKLVGGLDQAVKRARDADDGTGALPGPTTTRVYQLIADILP